MPVVKMQKVAIIIHESDRESLLEFLQNEGMMEVSPNEETEDIEHPRVSYEKAEVLFAINFLREAATKTSLKILRNPGTLEDIRRSALHTDFLSVIDDCKKLEDAHAELTKGRQDLMNRKNQLIPWERSDLRLNLRNTATTAIQYGSCSKTTFSSFLAALHEENPRSELTQVGEDSTNTLIVATVWNEDRDRFEQIAARFGFSEITIPKSETTPAQEVHRLEQADRVLDGKEDEILRLRSKLAGKFPDLVRLSHYLSWMNDKQAVRSEFSQTQQTVTLNGWIPEKKFDDLQVKMEAAFPAIALFRSEPKKNEEPPIQIRNSNAIAPFEAVTRLYGLPQGHEMDPTRPLMLFFILYFGLCLTDAGYGIVLATLMGAAIWKFRIKRQEQKLIWLLFYAGIVTFLVSIPFGGWFGMTPDQVPAWATYINANGDLRFLGQIWDLQKDVDFFRNLALSLGSIQILFGIFLAGYWKWIHGKRWEAFCSHWTVHIFVIALALKYGLQMPMMDAALIGIGALFIWGQGSGAWFVRPLIGALGAVSFLIGILSNVLSYLRILALGLATGALAFAINQIAVVISDLFPAFIGIPIFILILLGGHSVSIALNSLGSFVHSGRLQFIEFFGQFFQGGGREFAPFKRSMNSTF